MAKMSIDDKLGLDKFDTDEENAHIQIDENYANEEDIRRLVMACPAQLYKYEDGKLSFNYEGCLECGTCRVLSKGKVIKSWDHPVGGAGVVYKQG